ncbi:hypothetical protein AAE02nite_33160 [Adhaeribacter aerolatus]|uniref:Sialidase domain-containing protein n=1 Tax=Adhaeribacter aerolatus TaxID=670289 RepID=A0A512B128_9BACT|nr:sialidase family protein [Adhaeribacter aerolatus]GEO05652.1 hypothetical protein AAE02nite_33160 [Adhaeribacter aerolatus]
MKKLVVIAAVLLVIWGQVAFNQAQSPTESTIGAGKQPDVCVDTKGQIKIVFGQADNLYYVTSADNGKSFTQPVKIATLPKLASASSRGAKIAVTPNYTVIAAATFAGNIYALRMPHKTGKWSAPAKINDVDTVAKEGFVGLAAGKEDRVYTVWLDLRNDRKNKIYGAASENGGQSWTANKLLYRSPDKSVCECCRPTIVADVKGNVHVMFRNWLNGSRDMYLLSSADNGRNFKKVQKLGIGTWPLNACPMDGGDLAVDANGKINTVWRRDKEIFTALPGLPEKKLSEGRTPVLIETVQGPAVAWQQNGEILLQRSGSLSVQNIGKGAYPALAALPGGKSAVCAWERDGQVLVKVVPL